MTTEEMLSLAKEAGFARAAVVSTADIVFDPAFRPYCEENLCGQYGANYSCPPDCGTPEEMRLRVTAHKWALVLQTVWEVSDYADRKAIGRAKGSHNTAGLQLMQKLRSAGHPDCFMVGASGCSLCPSCTLVQGEPCRFPDLRYSCMSAYCVYVRKLAERCGMEYDCGKTRLALFGMLVFD